VHREKLDDLLFLLGAGSSSYIVGLLGRVGGAREIVWRIVVEPPLSQPL
jgi:hypothetical protein